MDVPCRFLPMSLFALFASLSGTETQNQGLWWDDALAQSRAKSCELTLRLTRGAVKILPEQHRPRIVNCDSEA